jgi:methylmalonyl-CoA mutase N-terminal domain/subunit
VEWLTDRTYRAIAAELDKIEAMGGALAAVHNGYVASRLTDGAYREQMAVESGEQIVVGVNRFQNEESLQYPRFRSDETAQVRKIDALQRARSTRDATALAKSLGSLEQACRSESNSMPAVIAAVAAGATVGEVAGVWRRAFGEVTSVRAHL